MQRVGGHARDHRDRLVPVGGRRIIKGGVDLLRRQGDLLVAGRVIGVHLQSRGAHLRIGVVEAGFDQLGALLDVGQIREQVDGAGALEGVFIEAHDLLERFLMVLGETHKPLLVRLELRGLRPPFAVGGQAVMADRELAALEQPPAQVVVLRPLGQQPPRVGDRLADRGLERHPHGAVRRLDHVDIEEGLVLAVGEEVAPGQAGEDEAVLFD